VFSGVFPYRDGGGRPKGGGRGEVPVVMGCVGLPPLLPCICCGSVGVILGSRGGDWLWRLCEMWRLCSTCVIYSV